MLGELGGSYLLVPVYAYAHARTQAHAHANENSFFTDAALRLLCRDYPSGLKRADVNITMTRNGRQLVRLTNRFDSLDDRTGCRTRRTKRDDEAG